MNEPRVRTRFGAPERPLQPPLARKPQVSPDTRHRFGGESARAARRSRGWPPLETRAPCVARTRSRCCLLYTSPSPRDRSLS
eukprot:4088908-Pyramimonas_sp.AAC.2